MDSRSPLSPGTSFTEVVTNGEVELIVLATDPDGDDLTYTYESLLGEIIGEGNMVIWVAHGAAGDYTITVDVSDGELNMQDHITITVGLEGMVLIPAGEFLMGDHFNEGDSGVYRQRGIQEPVWRYLHRQGGG